MVTTSLITWTDRFGRTITTRIVTAHIVPFTADVEETGGEVHQIETET
jgi:hypothetical protein